MKKKKIFKKRKIYWTGIIFLSLVIVFSLRFVLAWSEPGSAPPAGNTDKPLNISAETQYKAGALGIGGDFRTDTYTYLSSLSGKVGIGTNNPAEKLTLNSGNFLETAKSIKHIGSLADNASTLLFKNNDIYVSGKYAYIVSEGTIAYDDDGLEIVDISNPANPAHVGKISFGDCKPNCAAETPTGVFISGNYAYIASYSLSGLGIFDISNPANPKQVGNIKQSSCPECAFHYPRSVYVSGKYAYIASSKDDTNPGDGLEIVDISNPAKPTHAGRILNDDYAPDAVALRKAFSVYVSGKYAYVVSRGEWSDEPEGGLQIIDITNPNNPIPVGKITQATCPSCDFNNLDSSNSNQIVVSGSYAYIPSTNDNSLIIINVSNPNNPVFAGKISKSTCPSCNLTRPCDVQVAGKYAYVTSWGYYLPGPNNTSSGLDIIDISNPANPTYVDSITVESCPSCLLYAANALFVSGKYAYVVTRDYEGDSSYNGLEILDISGIDSPSANIGNIASGNITVTENTDIGNNLYVRSGLNVGGGGINSGGAIAGSDLETINMLKSSPTDNPATCDANMRGAMYYDKSAASPCFCNGTIWARFNNAANCN
jgi:hypothetical protein